MEDQNQEISSKGMPRSKEAILGLPVQSSSDDECSTSGYIDNTIFISSEQDFKQDEMEIQSGQLGVTIASSRPYPRQPVLVAKTVLVSQLLGQDIPVVDLEQPQTPTR